MPFIEEFAAELRPGARVFPSNDPLLAARCKAEDAIHERHFKSHDQSCGDVTLGQLCELRSRMVML